MNRAIKLFGYLLDRKARINNEIYTNGLREIAAKKQGIQNVKDIPLGQIVNEVA